MRDARVRTRVVVWGREIRVRVFESGVERVTGMVREGRRHSNMRRAKSGSAGQYLLLAPHSWYGRWTIRLTFTAKHDYKLRHKTETLHATVRRHRSGRR